MPDCIDVLGFDPIEHDPETAEKAVIKEVKEEDLDGKIKALTGKYSKGELKKILKDNGVKGYSKLEEYDLLKLIIENNINL